MNKMIVSLFLLFIFSSDGYAEQHDPTRPAKYVENQVASADISSLELSLTLIASDRKVVVINGLPLKMGDRIGGERVEVIESNSVRLVGPSGSITLFLLDKSVKTEVQ